MIHHRSMKQTPLVRIGAQHGSLPVFVSRTELIGWRSRVAVPCSGCASASATRADLRSSCRRP